MWSYRKKKLTSNRSVYQPSPINCLFDEYGFYIEAYFKDALYKERNRSERSGSIFLFIVINISSIVESDKYRKLLKKIASILHSSTRKTDTKGWYVHNSLIGIIMPEISEEEVILNMQKIYQRLYKNIQDLLCEESSKTFDIYFYKFSGKHMDHIDYEMKSELISNIESKNLLRKYSFFLKRKIDFLCSISFLLLFSPLLFIIALLIKISSDGPVFFRQERIGLCGKTFTILKFRSMYDNSGHTLHKDHIGGLLQKKNNSNTENKKKLYTYKIQDDPRITTIGRVIRKTNLDELPQLINVLKGEMSLVGPRPPLPYEFAMCELWQRRRVFEMKPGMTGLWQVRRRSDTTYNEMVRLDLQYVRTWSLWLDVKLLFATPWAIVTNIASSLH